MQWKTQVCSKVRDLFFAGWCRVFLCIGGLPPSRRKKARGWGTGALWLVQSLFVHWWSPTLAQKKARGWGTGALWLVQSFFARGVLGGARMGAIGGFLCQ